MMTDQKPTTADLLAARRYPDALQRIEGLTARVTELEAENGKLRDALGFVLDGLIRALKELGAEDWSIERIKKLVAALGKVNDETNE